MTAVLLDTKRIMEMIPHRYPFLLIDRILEVDPNERAVALKNVTMNENFFQGHFPGALAGVGNFNHAGVVDD